MNYLKKYSYWFTIIYWKYLLAPSNCDNIWASIKCRLKEHSCGPIWYNFRGLSPDMRCKNCYDDME